MIIIKTQKVLDNWENGYFLIVLPRAVFRTQDKVYGGALLQKYSATKLLTFSQKRRSIKCSTVF